jgi:hypothetical protein
MASLRGQMPWLAWAHRAFPVLCVYRTLHQVKQLVAYTACKTLIEPRVKHNGNESSTWNLGERQRTNGWAYPYMLQQVWNKQLFVGASRCVPQ